MPASTFKRELFTSGKWSFIGRAVSGGGSVVISLLLARLLTPTDLGAYFLFASLCHIGTMVLNVGLDILIVKRVAEVVAHDNLAGARFLIARTMGIVGLVCVPFVAFALTVGPLLIGLADKFSLPAGMLELLLLWFIGATFQRLLGEVFRGYRDIKWAASVAGSLYGGALSVCLYLVVLVPLLISGASLSLKTTVSISIAVTVATLIIGFCVLKRKYLAPAARAPSSEEVSRRALLREARPLWINNVAIVTLGQVDILLVGVLCRPEDLAIYGAVVRLVRFITTILFVSNEAIAPHVAQLYMQRRFEDLQWSVRAASTLSSLLALPVVLVFVCFGNYVLGYGFGAFFASGHLVLAILSCAQFARVLAGPNNPGLTMTGHGKLVMTITMVVAGYFFASGLLLGHFFGLLGIAIAVSSTHAIQETWMVFAVRLKCHVWTVASPHAALRLFRRGLSYVRQATVSSGRNGRSLHSRQSDDRCGKTRDPTR